MKETKPKKIERSSFNTELGIVIGLVLLYFFRGFVFKGITTFLPTYFVEERSFSVGWSGLITGLFFLTGALAQIYGGKLADKHDEVKILIYSSVLSALFLFTINSFTLGEIFVYILLALLGFFLFLSIPAILSLIHKVNPEDHYGKIFGATSTTVAISGAIAPVAIGHLADLYSLKYAFQFLPLLLLLAALTGFLMKNRLSDI